MNENLLNDMKITVLENENRPISFTNKKAGYYFFQSHETNHIEYKWFEGWNVSQKHIFSGYTLYLEGKPLNNKHSNVSVYPHKMIREFQEKITETFWMIENKDVLLVEVSETEKEIGLLLKGEDVNFLSISHNIAFFSSLSGQVIAVSSKNNDKIKIENNVIYTNGSSGGFYIILAITDLDATLLMHEMREHIETYKLERIHNMEYFLHEHVYLSSDDRSLSHALNWIHMTMNQLVTNQLGEGIYAGLPWFNEYWGRDEFISLPGATLVTGLFETARKILLSFAKFQNKDKKSKFFGRVPNILRVDQIDYHTTDGTPRFIIELLDYVKYTGDLTIIKELYETVQMSIEGSLENWVDEKGFLLHEDNETWMDARDENLKEYSPRGSRANDIEALWFHQLKAGVYFAEVMEDTSRADNWNQVINKLKNNFIKEFSDESYDYLADHITEKDKKDFALRPNQLFALDMIEDTEMKTKIIKKTWEELVYPWGVATLDQHHPLFHPYHLTEAYHKDEAYHNGTIWPWLNGIAMQRMIEIEENEIAYKLFKNMNWQALNLGVVGGLSENLDAYPHKGKSWPNLTGAYLQAWSNAEHLRIWYQYFLGMKPDLISHLLIIAPRIPNEINELKYQIKVGNGNISANYKKTEMDKTYHYHFHNIDLTLQIDLYPYKIHRIEISHDSKLQLIEKDQKLLIILIDKNDKFIKEIVVSEIREQLFKKIETIHFAQPMDISDNQS